MNFKGGTIIIGSLLWDEKPIRQKWRKLCLNDLSTKTPVRVKIRYGRESNSRENTYSMIFSNHSTTEYGQAYILGFNEVIKNSRILERQAFALASAEGLWDDKPSLNKSWGTVGLLVNPNIDKKDKRNADIIRERWVTIYKNYQTTFKSAVYRIEDEPTVMNDGGFLNIEWTDEMNEYDFLIATPTVPNINQPLLSKEIAQRMKLNNYYEYFEKNIANGITTFQDEEIKEMLKQ